MKNALITTVYNILDDWIYCVDTQQFSSTIFGSITQCNVLVQRVKNILNVFKYVCNNYNSNHKCFGDLITR